MALLSKKLQGILRDKRNKEKRKTFPKKENLNKNDQEGSSNTFTSSNTQPTCFECKKSKHFKSNCLIYLKKLFENEKKMRKLIFKKANLATQGKEDIDCKDEEEKEKEAHLCLMTFDDEIDEVYMI